MTTITYSQGTIAVDSRISTTNGIISDRSVKYKVIDNVLFIFGGSTSEEQRIIDWHFGKEVELKCPASVAALIWDGLVLLHRFIGEDGHWLHEVDLSQPYAMGSGESFAFTAMDLGHDAPDAIKIAMARDTSTGGWIRSAMLRPSPSAMDWVIHKPTVSYTIEKYR